jgi:hypothetical protein
VSPDSILLRVDRGRGTLLHIIVIVIGMGRFTLENGSIHVYQGHAVRSTSACGEQVVLEGPPLLNKGATGVFAPSRMVSTLENVSNHFCRTGGTHLVFFFGFFLVSCLVHNEALDRPLLLAGSRSSKSTSEIVSGMHFYIWFNS